MITENKPKKTKLILTEKELNFLREDIHYILISAEENSSAGSNGDPEDVEHFKNNPHEISALKKLNYFLRELKPNKRAKLISRQW